MNYNLKYRKNSVSFLKFFINRAWILTKCRKNSFLEMNDYYLHLPFFFYEKNHL